jgi:hypothetical protein
MEDLEANEAPVPACSLPFCGWLHSDPFPEPAREAEKSIRYVLKVQ